MLILLNKNNIFIFYESYLISNLIFIQYMKWMNITDFKWFLKILNEINKIKFSNL